VVVIVLISSSAAHPGDARGADTDRTPRWSPQVPPRTGAIHRIVTAEWFGATEASAAAEGLTAITYPARAAAVESVIAGYEALMHHLADRHAPEFLEIDITMPQAKLLYLLGASGELHMSELVQRLGVSLSTVSGLVDRVVDHGFATRREDPADRRQVVVGLTAAGLTFIDRFRELNAHEMRTLLDDLDDTELAHLGSALDALTRSATRSSTPRTAQAGALVASGPAATRKDPA
jgi:DNA-binding MarR family transcriptional regulator